MENFPDLRNYNTQKIRCYIDYMAVGMMYGVLAADPIPTTLVIVSLIALAVINKFDLDDNLNTIQLRSTFDIPSAARGWDRVIFKESGGEDRRPRVEGYLRPLFVVLPKELFSRESAYVRSIVAHERAHAMRQDPMISFLYFKLSDFLRVVIIAVPITFAFLSITGKVPISYIFGALPVLFYLAPSIYFNASSLGYRHRREFMADAEAANLIGNDYKSFIYAAAVREPFLKKNGDETDKTCPTFADRWGYLSGAKRTPSSSLFWYCFFATMAGVIAFFALGLNLVYQSPNDMSEMLNQLTAGGRQNISWEFHLTKVIVGFSAFSIWALNYLRILRIVFEFRKNGLSGVDRCYSVIGLLIGLLLGSVFSVYIMTQPLVTESSNFELIFLTTFIAICCTMIFFAVMQSLSSIFTHSSFFSYLIPIIVALLVLQNYWHYYDNTVLNHSSGKTMLVNSLYSVFVIFGVAQLLETFLCFISFVRRGFLR